MNVAIKRIDASLPLPTYQTPGSACFDLYSRIDITVPPQSLARIPSNLIIATPAHHALYIFARSSLAAKKHLMLSNSVGVVDSDYCGETDEILIAVYNFSDQESVIKKGERVAQASILPIPKITFTEVLSMNTKDRGGFGSTGS